MAVDEIGKNIWSRLLARADTYFYIKLLCIHDAVTCNIAANYSAVQCKKKFKCHSIYQSS